MFVKEIKRTTFMIVIAATLGVLCGAGSVMMVSALNKPEPKSNTQAVATNVVAPSTPNPGNFQLLPSPMSIADYPPEYASNFMKGCEATSGNNVDACSCSLEYLQQNYSFQQALAFDYTGIPEDLMLALRETCFLPQAGYGSEIY